jgi:hypothetical protein
VGQQPTFVHGASMNVQAWKLGNFDQASGAAMGCIDAQTFSLLIEASLFHTL